MTGPTIDWKKDSRCFDTVAELYDAHRPSYPVQLVDDILAISGIPKDARLLEIGSGTGIATAPFARKGYPILCIEPGERLAAVARKKLQSYPNVSIALSTFEDWDGDSNLFDLAFSAQAFHWIPKEIRYLKTAQVLKPNSYLAIFWNRYPPMEDPIQTKLNRVYQRFTPEMVTVSSSDYEESVRFWIQEIDESETFDLVEVRRYPWKQNYSTRQYLGLLNTYSDHLRLTEDRRQQLFAGLEEVLEQEGGRIEKPYEAVAYVARKRS